MMVNLTSEDYEDLKKIFENFKREKDPSSIFYDLCFCICAPQTTFKNNRKVIGELIRLNFYEYGIKQDVLTKI